MRDDPRHRLYERMDMAPRQCVHKPSKSRIEWVFWALVSALLWIFYKNA